MFDITYKIQELGIFEDLSFPRLVSYPRTGSHWFRILMEFYTGHPSVVQSFTDPNPKSVWGFHIHDRLIHEWEPSEGPTRDLKKVVYMYRNPVDTIYSQMKYHEDIPYDWNGDVTDNILVKVKQYENEYHDHLNRWLHHHEDVDEFMSVTYSQIKTSPTVIFRDVCNFLDYEWNESKFMEVYSKCTKDVTKRLTPHDRSVISSECVLRNDSWKRQKMSFVENFEKSINEKFEDTL